MPLVKAIESGLRANRICAREGVEMWCLAGVGLATKQKLLERSAVEGDSPVRVKPQALADVQSTGGWISIGNVGASTPNPKYVSRPIVQ